MASKRIILVDDEAYVTTTLASKFRQAGHEVLTAANGDEGFDLAMRNLPDLIITDYQMPVLSGYEMSVKLKENPATRSVPILMLSARGHHFSPEELARTNIHALFAKPFSARELVAKASQMLQPAVAGASP